MTYRTSVQGMVSRARSELLTATWQNLWEKILSSSYCVSATIPVLDVQQFLLLNRYLELQPGKQENLSPPQRWVIQWRGDPANQSSSQGELQGEVCGLLLPWPSAGGAVPKFLPGAGLVSQHSLTAVNRYWLGSQDHEQQQCGQRKLTPRDEPAEWNTVTYLTSRQ